MKYFLFLSVLFFSACSGLLPYKDQGLEDLTRIAATPQTYFGQVVSFTGDVKGTTEGTSALRLVLKIDTPLYYYATGKDPLSYQLILVEFQKPTPEMTGILKGHHLKILARVGKYEVRTGRLGQPIGVLYLDAFALSDRTTSKDFFRQIPPDYQLYQSWASGKLFYQEKAEDIAQKFPAPTPPQPAAKTPAPLPAPTPTPPTTEIVFEETEEFTLNPTETH